MDTLIINTFVAVIIAISSYFIKYKKKYHWLAGYSDYTEGKSDEKTKQYISLIANHLFLFSFLTFVFSFFNYIFKVDTLMPTDVLKDFAGGLILILSLIITIFAFVTAVFFKTNRTNTV
ncbi:MAG: hypothetical protein Q4G08_10955 [Capnocytophaga sp.]|nr:hypothetical protein [Capnocytophaga sp.]